MWACGRSHLTLDELVTQLGGMLDAVEEGLLRAHMPSVKYLRLDGALMLGW